ncbi:hypothetical protein SPF06_14780 [Sinomonas sp. JGH33]|uniref:Uncharacterized protein n=1 Tax=Sinomonas terricola TaxID=3110330 RepID=A0ABU5T8J3_9MICC|nr:hypothetical protein [Sinomonas sp. JGH33]MEA5455998.1 hypothetical protein [Sinomonas sp. JGH33]
MTAPAGTPREPVPREAVPREPLDAAQRRVLERLVGADVARQDEAAVAEAYADFRDAMDALRREFGGQR